MYSTALHSCQLCNSRLVSFSFLTFCLVRPVQKNCLTFLAYAWPVFPTQFFSIFFSFLFVISRSIYKEWDDGCSIVILWGVACKICSKQLVAFSSFSPHFSLSSKRVHPYGSFYTVITWKKFYFIVSESSDFHMITCQYFAVYMLTVQRPSSWSGNGFFFYKTHGLCFICVYIEANTPAPGYAVGIRLGLVYLREALDRPRLLRIT